MNSYFKAIKQATTNYQFPELEACWRVYHPTSNLMDSDYSLFTENACSNDDETIIGDSCAFLVIKTLVQVRASEV